jgi:putative flippase GtrA
MRLLKFNTVSALGMVVHLGSLALMTHIFQTHYALAATIAVELAVLHNFAWHWRWTWADRRSSGNTCMSHALLRFNLSTGIVSIGGNLAFVNLFSGVLGWDPVISGMLSIVPTAVVNYLFSDRWVFLCVVRQSLKSSKLPGHSNSPER